MSTPQSTPIRHAKLGIASTKSLPLTNEYKKLLAEQHQRLSTKHQQDVDLIDDIRSYVKARLSIERDYTTALNKLAKQHSNHIAKKFTLLNQCDAPAQSNRLNNTDGGDVDANKSRQDDDDARIRKRLTNNGQDGSSERPCTLYKVWSEHINRLQTTSKNRADQFEQLILIVDKLKNIRTHKANIGKKCLDTHLKRIQEDIMVSMVELERARKLYNEDESQAKKARENEEKIKKKRSGLLTKFTDIQAKKEKSTAQREANDIQSTQARNDYIMALAAANAHLQHYYHRDLSDFIQLIDDGVLDHCKIFMATLSECDLNSLKDALSHAQYWSKMINLTSSQRTNTIFLDCEQSNCLRAKSELLFEPCNDDPIHRISLEYNADYALQHEIDKWFTWFKKECRNLSQLMHQLETCQHAFAEGKKCIELNGQNVEDLEPKIIELKQQIRKSEAAKLKAQARLKVIKEGGMQIEEWSAVESEIRADMAREQDELKAKRPKEVVQTEDSNDVSGRQDVSLYGESQVGQVQLQVSKDSDVDSDVAESMHNLASVSRSTSNLVQKQQNAMSGYSALTDPSLVWQDDYSGAWSSAPGNQNVIVTDAFDNNKVPSSPRTVEGDEKDNSRYDLLSTSQKHTQASNHQQNPNSVQSSSPLSAIVNGQRVSPSPYQGTMNEAYKSDYECDYNVSSHLMRSAASSAEPNSQYMQQQQQQQQYQGHMQTDPFGKPLDETAEFQDVEHGFDQSENFIGQPEPNANDMLNKRVVALYSFEKNNEDDLAFKENDILLVIEVNDANWLKARNELTSEEGFIPSSYVKLQDDHLEGTDSVATETRNTNMDSFEPNWSDHNVVHRDDTLVNQSNTYCRALYDHKLNEDTFEEDGFPHLSLTQGELFKIIDQGEDDGWWLVEKEGSGIRGHVPSMLVEEIDPNEEEEGDEQYEDDAVDGYYEDSYEQDVVEEDECGKACPPSIEPPILGESDNLPDGVTDSQETDSKIEVSKSRNLVPTSFIIIEPTPEVESKHIEDELKDAQMGDNYKSDGNESQDDRSIIQSTNIQPSSDVSYSVINNDFVLEKPTRKPHCSIDSGQHHDTPTILEESAADDVTDGQGNDSTSKFPDGCNYEPLSEVDSVDIPAPPSVVVESFEDENQNKSQSSDGNLDDESSRNSDDFDQSLAQSPYKQFQYNEDVNISPTISRDAEELSRQIIEEALMLAPGADIGPSTSSAGDTDAY